MYSKLECVVMLKLGWNYTLTHEQGNVREQCVRSKCSCVLRGRLVYEAAAYYCTLDGGKQAWVRVLCRLSMGKRISMRVNGRDLVCGVYMMLAECSVCEEVASNEPSICALLSCQHFASTFHTKQQTECFLSFAPIAMHLTE